VPFIDCDGNNPDSESLAAKYGVIYVPTLVFIDKNGEAAGKLVGNIDENTIKQNVEKILK
jgi:thiol:disulfide interchange protein